MKVLTFIVCITLYAINCVIFFEKNFIILILQTFVSRWSKDLFLSKQGWNYSLSSINTTWDLSREDWWDLIIFKFIEVLEGLTEFNWIREFGLQFSFFHPKESCTQFEILIFFGCGTHLYISLFPSICPSIRLSCTTSQEPYII